MTQPPRGRPATTSPDTGEVVAGEVVHERVEGVVEGSVVEPVDVVARAVMAVPGVHSLRAGTAAAAAARLRGRRATGVQLRPDGTDVHVVVRFGADVAATAEAVRAAVTGLGPLAPQPVHVHVDDVAPPGA